jgi:hypothetical protein
LTFAGRFWPEFASNEADSPFTSGPNDPNCSFIHLNSLFLDLLESILPHTFQTLPGKPEVKATLLKLKIRRTQNRCTTPIVYREVQGTYDDQQTKAITC